MASIIDDPNGRRRIQFTAGDGTRKTVRLGQMDRKTAETARTHIERIIGANMGGGAWPDETSRWLAGLPDLLHGRLAAAGLVARRNGGGAVTLKAFIDGYLSQRPDVKAGTMMVFRQAQRWLQRFLGENRPLADVTPADADAFRAHMLGEGRARATTNKWCQYARHFFAVAVRRKLITENPFEHIRGAVRGNVAKRYFVKPEEALKIIDAAPDLQWKVLIALARWGGLRIPSEALALTWRDVDWGNNRIIIRASKTAHHEDGGVRIMPLFPELRPYLEQAFDEAEEGALYVITRYRDPAANLRTQLVRYIEAAKLKPWPKPWQNMRASRATELADVYPSHVCAAWLGHTEAVADEFYRQVTDEHFNRAIGADVKAAQKAAQNPAVTSRDVKYSQKTISAQQDDSQYVTSSYDTLPKPELGAAGTEHPSKTLAKPQISETGGAKSGAPGDASASNRQPADPDLQAIIDAWPTLPDDVRRTIAGVVRLTPRRSDSAGRTGQDE